GLLLGGRGAGRAGHDRARVAHRLALGGGEAGDVTDDRLGDVLLDVRGGTLLGVAADLADHHDRLGLRVVLEGLERVDVRGADDRVAADADGGREPEVLELVHHLIGQRARLGHEADRALARDGVRRDAGQRLARGDDAGAVRADHARLLAVEVGPDLGRVLDRYAL